MAVRVTSSASRTRVSGAEPNTSPSPLLTNPDPDLPLGWIDWCGRLVHSLAARGNAYAIHLDRDGLGYPTVSRVVHPDDIRPVKAKTGRKEFEVSAGRTLDGRTHDAFPEVSR
jgi:hypothetical protein